MDAVHLDTLRSHGGLPGIRDENALESALARPRNRWAYSQRVDMAALAATYGYGIARNHPYRDGNKRAAFLCMWVFLGLNGLELEVPEAEAVAILVRLAAGEVTEATLAKWIRSHTVPYRDD